MATNRIRGNGDSKSARSGMHGGDHDGVHDGVAGHAAAKRSPKRSEKRREKRSEVTSGIGIPDADRESVVQILAAVLADQHVLYQKTRMCHWNLVGGRFDPLHRMFEQQYEALAEAIDETAERIRMIDGVAPGGMQELLALATLAERPSELLSGQDAIELLVDDHESCIRELRIAIDRTQDEHHDAGTADFLTGLMRAHEKTAWMLRSHTEGRS